MNLLTFCFWADRAVLGSTENSTILLKYPAFESCLFVFSWTKKLKIEFLYTVVTEKLIKIKMIKPTCVLFVINIGKCIHILLCMPEHKLPFYATWDV